LKETSSELKKVTWPKFTTVLKQTGVVLAVTAAFLLVVFGIDMLCSWLVKFIVK
jgi:preprotein translocase SecE subunit